MMTGQIIKRGETWLVRIFLGRDTTGKRKYLNKTIHGTKKDAQKYLTAKLREKDLGELIEPNLMGLNDYLEKWLQDVAQQKLRKSTYTSYESVLKNYVKNTIGKKKISELQAFEVQKLYNEMIKKGLSARTVRYTHVVLSSALKQAVRWKIIRQNPCELCELPRLEKKEMKYLSTEETTKFLKCAKETRHYCVFFVAVETGMRPEEYLALKWSDIDFENQTMSVKRAIVWHRKGGGYDFTETKTKKSRRSIPFSNELAKELKKHRTKQLESRIALGESYQNLELVFASEVGTPLYSKNIIDRHFKPLLKKAELPDIRLYDLRHTTATLLLSAGENPKVVSERLGHASIVLTLDTYSHVLPTMQKEATTKMEKLLFG